jgi:hypothetical protein
MHAPLPARNATVAAGLVVFGLFVGSDRVRTALVGVVCSGSTADEVAARAESARLDEYGRLCGARNRFNEALVGDLAAGRVGLADALDAFLSANADRPDYVEAVHLTYRTPTPRESAALNLLVRVAARAGDRTVGEGAVLDRLRAEYAELFGYPPRRDVYPFAAAPPEGSEY